MKERESVGGRIDNTHPYPPDARYWLPATGHPLGYSLLLFLLYRITNYTWMIILIHVIQGALDAFVCLLVYVFIRNLFGSRPALVGAWIYALLPAPIILTLRLQPDSLSCFFAATILALGTYIPTRGVRYGLLTGAAVGLASQFRAEFMMWSVIVICVLMLSHLSVVAKVRSSIALLLAHFVMLLPWMYWTQSATGSRLLTGSQGGSSIYEALGELQPKNPWGIILLDEWIMADAAKRGFTSPWSPEADAYYRAAFYSCIRSHPLSYLKLVVVHRLPVALAPPFSARVYERNRFNFMDYRLKQGLTRWAVARSHPWLVLKNMWPSLIMALVSLALLVGMLAGALAYRREWRRVAWIAIPWLFTVLGLALLKEIEPRNVSAIIVPEVAGMALLVAWLLQRIEICDVNSR